MMTDDLPKTQSEILIYQTEDGRMRIDVRLEDETVWLSQKLLAELFQKDVRTTNEHIKNIYADGELVPKATIRKFRIVHTEGKRQVTRQVDYYNLDVMISVGNRVRSHRGTQFRIWATQRLREYIIKGFTLDDERLKQAGGGNYFDEPPARIRDIRSSEAAHGHTAAEIVARRADATKPNMGLSSWSGDKPLRSDAEIAKSYLTAEELDALNRIVTIYNE